MKKIKFIGGARLGGTNLTWPLVRLEISETHLTLKTILLTTYKFSENDISSIGKVSWLPIIAEGIRIYHNVQKYPKFIVFWYWKPKTLIDELKCYNNKVL